MGYYGSEDSLLAPAGVGFGEIGPTGLMVAPNLSEGVSPMYYNNGFLPAGGAQTGGIGGVLSVITSGLETFLPRMLAGGTGTVPTARTPPILPTPQPRGTMSRVMGSITKTATQHPVLTAVAGAAATGGGAVLARRMGRRAPGTLVQASDGTILLHHRRRMNACNIHALRRALRRAGAFERIAKRVLHVTTPHKQVKGFKIHKRKRS